MEAALLNNYAQILSNDLSDSDSQSQKAHTSNGKPELMSDSFCDNRSFLNDISMGWNAIDSSLSIHSRAKIYLDVSSPSIASQASASDLFLESRLVNHDVYLDPKGRCDEKDSTRSMQVSRFPSNEALVSEEHAFVSSAESAINSSPYRRLETVLDEAAASADAENKESFQMHVFEIPGPSPEVLFVEIGNSLSSQNVEVSHTKKDSKTKGSDSKPGLSCRRSYRQQTAELIGELDKLLCSRLCCTPETVGKDQLKRRRKENFKPRARNVVLKEAADLIWRIQIDEQAMILSSRSVMTPPAGEFSDPASASSGPETCCIDAFASESSEMGDVEASEGGDEEGTSSHALEESNPLIELPSKFQQVPELLCSNSASCTARDQSAMDTIDVGKEVGGNTS